MGDFIFVTDLFNVEKLCSEIAIKGKLNNIKFIYFLVIPTEKNWVYEILIFELDIVIVKNSIKVQYKTSNINKN